MDGRIRGLGNKLVSALCELDRAFVTASRAQSFAILLPDPMAILFTFVSEVMAESATLITMKLMPLLLPVAPYLTT